MGRTLVTVASLPWRAVEVQQPGDVDVGQPVAVGDHEGVAVDVALDALDASAGHRVGAGVGQRDA